MDIQLEYGRGAVAISIEDRKVRSILQGPEVPPLAHPTIAHTIAQGLRDHAPLHHGRGRVVVIVPDNTRLWARGDLFVPVIVDALLELGFPAEAVTVIIALGTHAAIPAAGMAPLVGTIPAAIRVVNSANRDQSRLLHLGTTSRGTPVDITTEACSAEHVIIFGGILHHLIAGFGGGRKYILPGIAGHDAIQHNHSLAISGGKPHPAVGQAILAGNPVHEDLEEAMALFLQGRSCLLAAVAANGRGELCWAETGETRRVFARGCDQVNRACAVSIERPADFALISAGGYRSDGQLYQATKALFNAAGSVRPGGDILLVAETAEGLGNPAFGDLLKRFHRDPAALGRQLADTFAMPAYVAFRIADLCSRYRISLISSFSREETLAMGFHPVDDLDRYLALLPGQGYVIPYAENILPLVENPV